MTWNLQRLIAEGASIGGTLDRLIANEVDVVGFQEITRDQAFELARLLEWPEPFYVQAKDPSDESEFIPGDGEVACANDTFALRCIPFGNAILSRYPMAVADRDLVPLPASEPEEGKEYRQLMRARITVDGVAFHIYNTHLAANPSQGTPAGLQARSDQAQVVLNKVEADRVSATGRYRPILTCDCNSDDTDAAMTTKLGSVFDDAWSAKGVGDGGTSVGSGRRIDYVLVGKQSGIPIVAARVDRTGGLSDHFSLTAVL